jgi:UDP-N-acetylmuramyl tripeptide synthase
MKTSFLVSLVGKGVLKASRLRGGHGSALPGYVVERMAPNFLRDVLGQLPRGVVVISGTNGKTTTTKMVVELLQASGLKVFTNRSGSNFARGVISAAVGEMRHGRLDAEIAVLELDEAHAVRFAEEVAPRYVLALNVLSDQEERFGGVHETVKLLEKVAMTAQDGVVLNRDNLVATIQKSVTVPVQFFGYSSKLADRLPYGGEASKKAQSKERPDVELVAFSEGKATYKIDGKLRDVLLQLSGVHNIVNAAAALTMVRMILGKKADTNVLLKALAQVKPAFGRGETKKVNGANVQMTLVKNPSSFRSALLSELHKNDKIMIAINSTPADGENISWMADVDFSAIKTVEIVSGMRAHDMADYLKKDSVVVKAVEPDVKIALDQFLSGEGNKQIICNYSAMLRIRDLVEKYM